MTGQIFFLTFHFPVFESNQNLVRRVACRCLYSTVTISYKVTFFCRRIFNLNCKFCCPQQGRHYYLHSLPTTHFQMWNVFSNLSHFGDISLLMQWTLLSRNYALLFHIEKHGQLRIPYFPYPITLCFHMIQGDSTS